MPGLPWRPSRRVSRLSLRRAYAALYSRKLYLPPSTLPRRAYPKGHALVVGLQPFRRRLHRQRAAVTVLRAFILAALAATIILLIRAFGFAVAMPAAPLVGAGGVLLLGLAAIAWERPTPGEMAHEIDRGLNLHEQIGSALELDATDQDQGRLGALLWQRAGTTLREANPAYVLPAPSLQTERRVLLSLIGVVGICTLVAANAPLRHPSLSLAQGATAAARRHASTHNAAGRHSLTAVKLWTIGAAARIRRATASSPGAHGTSTKRAALGAAQQGANGHLLVGKGAALRSGQQGHGTHSPTLGNGAQAGTRGQNGRAGGQNGALNLRPGQNSATGGVSSPQQQALQSLQNSITSASKQHTPQGQGTSGGQTARTGTQGQGKGSRNGHNQQGRSNHNGAAGRQGNGANGRGRQSPNGQGQGTAQGQGNSSLRNGRPGGADDPNLNGRLGRPGTGSGSDSGANTPSGKGSATGHAQVGDNAAITLNGANSGSSPLVLSIGLPNRGSGALGVGGTSPSSTTGPLIGIPGYVAPDSNAVTPDDRAVVRGYFSPPPGG